MERYLQKHLASVLAALVTSGIVGAVTITLQNRMDNELTRQRIAQIDSMVTDVGRRLEKIQDLVQSSVIGQKVAILETRVEELEKRVNYVEKKAHVYP